MDDILLTPRDAARLLGVKPSTLQRWRMAGSGPPYIKLTGKLIRYRHADLIAWLEQHNIATRRKEEEDHVAG